MLVSIYWNSQKPWLTLDDKHILDVNICLNHKKCSFVSVVVKWHLAAWLSFCHLATTVCEFGKRKLSEYPLLYSTHISKEEYAACSHKDKQSLLQFQAEHIRSPQLISYSKDKILMTFYLRKCDKIFSVFHHFLYLVLHSCCLS